jgi:hypothetical protein
MTKTLDEREAGAALVLARISSKTRIRLNERGIAVETPSAHARRLVRLLARVAGEPYLASPEHNERALREFQETRDRLREVVPPAPFKVTVQKISTRAGETR